MIKQINPAAKHAPASARIGFRRISRNFMSGASVLTLAIAGCASLSATMAHADPAITWTGDVSPTPTPGTTEWNPTSRVSIKNGGTLTISGGATMGVGMGRGPIVDIGTVDGPANLNSRFIVDGARSVANVNIFTLLRGARRTDQCQQWRSSDWR